MIIQKSDVLRWQFFLSAKLVKGPFCHQLEVSVLRKPKKWWNNSRGCEITLSKELMVICMIELLRKKRRSWCLGSELEWKGFLWVSLRAWICPRATPKRWHQSFHPSDSPTLLVGTMKIQIQIQIHINSKDVASVFHPSDDPPPTLQVGNYEYIK